MSIPELMRAAQDPTLVPGIYNTCDQWCMYCHATAWCLAYRSTSRAPAAGNGTRDVYDRFIEGIMHLARMERAEARPTGRVDEFLVDDQGVQTRLRRDPLLRMAERYAELSSAYLRTRPDFPFEMKRRDPGPMPLEVFAWYHVLVAAKVYRALYAGTRATRGDATCRDDSLASAKVALIGIDRSLDALATMTVDDDDPRLPPLQSQLRRLRREVDGRFPDARSFVRPGLD